jgi:hypothetical protein
MSRLANVNEINDSQRADVAAYARLAVEQSIKAGGIAGVGILLGEIQGRVKAARDEHRAQAAQAGLLAAAPVLAGMSAAEIRAFLTSAGRADVFDDIDE